MSSSVNCGLDTRRGANVLEHGQRYHYPLFHLSVYLLPARLGSIDDPSMRKKEKHSKEKTCGIIANSA